MSRYILFAALVALAPIASANEIVRYQLANWKAKHIHDTSRADVIQKTLTRLGCEVNKSQHNGHIDLTYRCPKWKQLTLDSHAEAHKWESWLKEFEFKTEHKH